MATYDEDVSIVRPYDERGVYNERLEEIIQLNKDTGAAARVDLDLEREGPLYTYLTDVRDASVNALMEIITADPSDAVGIAILQQQALKYREISEHIYRILDIGKNADRFIKEEYGDDTDGE